MTVNKITNKAFTIVELIIVVVIIGILAAITIVSYGTMTSRANTTSLISAANTVVTKAEVYNANNGEYPHTLNFLQTLSSTDSAYVSTSAASYFDFSQTTVSNISTGMSAPTSPMNKVRYIVCGYRLSPNNNSAPATTSEMRKVNGGVTLGVIGLTWNFNTSAIDVTNYQGIVNFGNGFGVQNTAYNVGGTTYNTVCLASGS